MKRLGFALLVIGLLALCSGGCGTARRPPAGLVEPTLDAAQQEGRRLFMQHCHSCHPGGEAGLGPAINNKPLPASLIEFQARHGLGAMPAFEPDELADEDLQAIADYLIALRQAR